MNKQRGGLTLSLARAIVQKNGAVEVDPALSQGQLQDARIAALRSHWALDGLGSKLVRFSVDSLTLAGDYDTQMPIVSEGVPYLLDSTETSEATKRLIARPTGRAALRTTIATARKHHSLLERHTALRRLGMVDDIMHDRIEKPRGESRGIIFTQTGLHVGKNYVPSPRLPRSVAEVFRSGVEAFSAFMPYLGAAMLYSELMESDRFQSVDIIDFYDAKAVDTALSGQIPYDYAFVTGATTYDRQHIRELNRQIALAEIPCINGGAAPSMDAHPDRFIRDGVSVFRGDMEGAIPSLLDELERHPEPRIYERGAGANTRYRLPLNGSKAVTVLPISAKADIETYYDSGDVNGLLARRLEGLAASRMTFGLGDSEFEIPNFFRIHQMNISSGCPERCNFCATVGYQGTKMRHRSLESIEQELIAVDEKIIAITDQNLTANGRDYFVGLLELFKKHGKSFAYEGELDFYSVCGDGDNPQHHFFDGSPADSYRTKLLKDTILAIEVGLEQPVKVGGTIIKGKNPETFAKPMQRLCDLGIMVFGTAMVGMPKELWSAQAEGEETIVPYENLTSEEWNEMIDTWVNWSAQFPGVILFPFEPIPGSEAYAQLEALGLLNYTYGTENTDDTLRPLQEDPVIGIAARKALAEIQERVFSKEMTKTRMSHADYALKARIFMEIFNRGSRMAFGNRMQ